VVKLHSKLLHVYTEVNVENVENIKNIEKYDIFDIFKNMIFSNPGHLPVPVLWAGCQFLVVFICLLTFCHAASYKDTPGSISLLKVTAYGDVVVGHLDDFCVRNDVRQQQQQQLVMSHSVMSLAQGHQVLGGHHSQGHADCRYRDYRP